jgi:molecular chaperone GrpE
VKNLENNRETLEVEVFDTDALPSLEDLMTELEQVESGAPAQTPHFAATEEEMQAMRQRIFLLEHDNYQLKETLEKTSANFDKYRWRAERERSDHYAFAVVNIVREFLPILDNFRRALQNAPAESSEQIADFTGGVELIYQQTIKFLQSIGVTPIDAVGEPFDPRYHEAVAVEPNSNLSPNTVTAEVLRGYRMGDKLIRAAMVKVSQ